MRKLIIATTIAALAVLPAAEGFAKKKAAKLQTVEGTIEVPQPYAADGSCIYRTHRTAYIAAGESSNGGFGWVFEVDPATVNKPFKLEVAGGAGMDISFYMDMGDPTDPTTAPANTGFETPGPGGESGIVPDGYKYGFVCMTEGANAGFTYTAGKGVKP